METNQTMNEHALMKSGIEPGSLITLEIRKRGVQKGRGANKTTYGDDKVLVVLMVGADPERIKALSDERLRVLLASKTLVRDLIHAVRRQGGDATVAEAYQGIQAVIESLAEHASPVPLNSQKELPDPLLIEGKRIPASRVQPNGTILLGGLKLAQLVLEPAKHSLPKVLNGKAGCQYILRKMLPEGLWASYSLAPSDDLWRIWPGTPTLVLTNDMCNLAERLRHPIKRMKDQDEWQNGPLRVTAL